MHPLESILSELGLSHICFDELPMPAAPKPPVPTPPLPAPDLETCVCGELFDPTKGNSADGDDMFCDPMCARLVK